MLRREAASWLARLQSGRDPEIERKVDEWLDRDPRHAAAFEHIRRTYDQAALLRHSRLASDRTPAPSRQVQQKPRYALAAAAAAIVLVPAGMLLLGRGTFAVRGTEAVMLATRVGEIRSVALSDGSKVTLDTATTLEIEIGRLGRKARLKSGRARFEIAAAVKPFVVEAGSTTVTADTGVVDVARTAQQSKVEMVSGNAEVRHDGAKLALSAGQAVADGSQGMSRTDSSFTRPDWTRGMLQFDGTPLADAVVLANRYSDRRILLSPGLGSLKVTGAFRAGDTEGLAKALAQAFHLSFSRTADGSLLLSRGSSSSADK
jgi:transmembrane sensor